jgi:cytosine/adenosine deaminase-related metal-dependent hydrolase
MNEGGGVFFADERIPVEAALRAVTIDAAWQCRMDDIIGSLEPGKCADLALLECDPTAVDPTENCERQDQRNLARSRAPARCVSPVTAIGGGFNWSRQHIPRTFLLGFDIARSFWAFH